MQKNRVCLSQFQKEQLVYDFEIENMSRKQLAERYNVCLATITVILNAWLGLSGFKRKIAKEYGMDEIQLIRSETTSFKELYIPSCDNLCVGDIKFN